MPRRKASSTIRRFSSRDHERREAFTLSLVAGPVGFSSNALKLHIPSGVPVKCPLLVDGHLPILTMTTKDPTLASAKVCGQQPTLTEVEGVVSGGRLSNQGVFNRRVTT